MGIKRLILILLILLLATTAYALNILYYASAFTNRILEDGTLRIQEDGIQRILE